MKNTLTRIREDDEGAFTLVELMVVMLIIGILVIIAVPAFLDQRKAAVDISVQSDIKNAATQIQTWTIYNPSTVVPSFDINEDGTVEPHLGEDATDVAELADVLLVGENTWLTVTSGDEGTPGTYQIYGGNAGGKASTNGGMVYDSTLGGFVK